MNEQSSNVNTDGQMTYSILFLSISIQGFLVCFQSSTTVAQELPEPLLHYSFDGHLKDSVGSTVLEEGNFHNRRPVEEAKNAQFEGGTLVVDGELARPSFSLKGFSLNRQNFTLLSRFKPFQSCTGECNIVTGGHWTRWFTIFRNENGRLTVGFNYERTKYETPFKIESGKWYLLVCNVDFKNKAVKISVNGANHEFNLAKDFALKYFEPKLLFDKGDERSCRAYIDEFCVYNGSVAPSVAASWFELSRIVKLIKSSNCQTAANRSNRYSESVKREIFSQLKGAGLPATEHAFLGFLQEFASQREPDPFIRNLVQELGGQEFETRTSAAYKLRLIGLPTLSLLNQAIASDSDPEVVYRAQGLVQEITASDFASLANVEFLHYDCEANGQSVPLAIYGSYILSSLAESNRDLVRARICEILLSNADSTNESLIKPSLNDPDQWVRLTAALLLSEIESPSKLSSALQPLLSDKDELVRLAATYLLTQNDPEPSPDSLKEFCDSSNWKIGYVAKKLAKQPMVSTKHADETGQD